VNLGQTPSFSWLREILLEILPDFLHRVFGNFFPCSVSTSKNSKDGSDRLWYTKLLRRSGFAETTWDAHRSWGHRSARTIFVQRRRAISTCNFRMRILSVPSFSLSVWCLGARNCLELWLAQSACVETFYGSRVLLITACLKCSADPVCPWPQDIYHGAICDRAKQHSRVLFPHLGLACNITIISYPLAFTFSSYESALLELAPTTLIYRASAARFLVSPHSLNDPVTMCIQLRFFLTVIAVSLLLSTSILASPIAYGGTSDGVGVGGLSKGAIGATIGVRTFAFLFFVPRCFTNPTCSPEYHMLRYFKGCDPARRRLRPL